MAATLSKSSGDGKARRRADGDCTPRADDLLAWYERHARRLPWRVGPVERKAGRRPDPYFVLLSEVMLQQTTVKAVGPYFLRFIERWPGIRDLAAAPEGDVMAAWAGLGYYSRARNLMSAARLLAARPDALFPRSAAELSALPGIGSYTSAAIAALVFDEPVAVVDGNVERVVTRLFGIDTPLPQAKEEVRAALAPMVPAEHAGAFAEALMDLGATICTPRKPACSLCPWAGPCIARREGRQEELPRRGEKKPRPTRYGSAFVARRADGAILLRRRPLRGLLGGMCEVPGSVWSAGKSGEAGEPFAAEWHPLAAPVAHTFTHFELRLTVRRTDVDDGTPAPPGHWWSAAADLPREALPSVMKKTIEAAYPGATKPRDQ